MPFPVLIVDDNPIDQELAAIYIRTAWPFWHDLEIHFAGDGHTACAMLANKPYALVVLDWKLPHHGDGAVLQQLRRDRIRVPVVVLSGQDRAEINADLTGLQAAYLNKNDMSPAAFHQAIAHALRLLGYKVIPDRPPAVIAPTPALAGIPEAVTVP